MAERSSKLDAATEESARKAKDQLLTDEIEELNRKGQLMHQENMELYKKVYGQRSADETRRSALNSGFNFGDDQHMPIQLQLSQPQPQQYEASSKVTTLRQIAVALNEVNDCRKLAVYVSSKDSQAFSTNSTQKIKQEDHLRLSR
ncbi:hypothetical protein EJ110_NYTH51721 [Nymphaea thermarum]|nr:hypothetical protein EJ110_NYTH51721 [Nymphaea thermarum]